ncbi:conserved hypothetical protein [Rippkaea orientalis PCC 8801]|uniref:DUF3082 domain-containing protein n=1 Tax=Rippkaea orientalis (strain PCC 8801 / RF-1) TaxID=41431 RepID=B7JVY6_RIPO1|nr:DUF3082 domain-containing protein [Rippkaea orientalis]ACK65675.1 conserved hypothetical protein [Rippkaea orientalis PCC 8801]
MTDSPNPSPSNPDPEKEKVTPLRCLIGSTISGTLAIALYSLTASIFHSFATKPLTSNNALVLRIGSLVRTLVMGVASLGTFIFAFVAFGLILLAIQLSFQGKSS